MSVLALTPASAVARLHDPALPASTLNATDEAHLHYVRNDGSNVFEEGTVKGALPGTMHANLDIAPIATGSFTFYTHYGTITGHGSAHMHGSGGIESFSGTLTITSGTGRYTHARGHANLYGTFNRRNYALVVQTSGALSY